MPPGPPPLSEQFGAIDIYLFDQLLRGRLGPGTRILDAGCGSGRNLVYLMGQRYDVCGVDRSERAIEQTRAQARRLAPDLAGDQFRVEAIEALSFPDNSFGAVVCSAVLHFADSPSHFERMVAELWRVLAPEGLFFTRLASSIGIETSIVRLGSGRYRLPDGSDRYLVDEATLVDTTTRLGGRLADPIKTTNVQGQRCMTTWCVWKPPSE
jgi:tellurite methyltransferase